MVVGGRRRRVEAPALPASVTIKGDDPPPPGLDVDGLPVEGRAAVEGLSQFPPPAQGAPAIEGVKGAVPAADVKVIPVPNHRRIDETARF